MDRKPQKTSLQRQALPRLIQTVAAIDPSCGIVLQGSVQHGCETATSDIDLLVLLDDQRAADLRDHWLIQKDKKGIMIRAEDEASGLNVDLIWFFTAEFNAMLRRHGASNYYIFAHGEILHDPRGYARSGQTIAMDYFARHPAVADAWTAQNAEVRRHKADPSHVLKYPRWPEFSVHLATLEQQ